MAENSNRVDWERAAGGASGESPHVSAGMGEDRPGTVRQREAALRRAALAVSFALCLFLLSWMGKGTWLVRSPLLKIFACAGFLALLVVHGFVWVLTGSPLVLWWIRQNYIFNAPGTGWVLVGTVTLLVTFLLWVIRYTRDFSWSEAATRRCVSVLVGVSVALAAGAIVVVLWRALHGDVPRLP